MPRVSLVRHGMATRAVMRELWWTVINGRNRECARETVSSI